MFEKKSLSRSHMETLGGVARPIQRPVDVVQGLPPPYNLPP